MKQQMSCTEIAQNLFVRVFEPQPGQGLYPRPRFDLPVGVEVRGARDVWHQVVSAGCVAAAREQRFVGVAAQVHDELLYFIRIAFEGTGFWSSGRGRPFC